jgi:transposase
MKERRCRHARKGGIQSSRPTRLRRQTPPHHRPLPRSMVSIVSQNGDTEGSSPIKFLVAAMSVCFNFPNHGDRMRNFYWLNEAQMDRLRPYFPKSPGRARVDDRHVFSEIIFFNRNGLRWCEAPEKYGPPKTLYNRWKRWSDMGVLARIMTGLAEQAPDNTTISIDATYLKALAPPQA